MIAAAAADNALGKDNDLLWHLPDDFKRFKQLTTGHAIIMGRKTFESFPKPLPKRKHIIITRDKKYTTTWDNCFVVHSFEEAFNLCKDEKLSYIIGGGEIYKQGEKFATKIELTRVAATFSDADTYFPVVNMANWRLVSEEFHAKDAKHKFDFWYQTFER